MKTKSFILKKYDIIKCVKSKNHRFIHTIFMNMSDDIFINFSSLAFQKIKLFTLWSRYPENYPLYFECKGSSASFFHSHLEEDSLDCWIVHETK